MPGERLFNSPMIGSSSPTSAGVRRLRGVSPQEAEDRRPESGGHDARPSVAFCRLRPPDSSLRVYCPGGAPRTPHDPPAQLYFRIGPSSPSHSGHVTGPELSRYYRQVVGGADFSRQAADGGFGYHASAAEADSRTRPAGRCWRWRTRRKFKNGAGLFFKNAGAVPVAPTFRKTPMRVG